MAVMASVESDYVLGTDKAPMDTIDEKSPTKSSEDVGETSILETTIAVSSTNHLHRRLGNRQIQVFAIGGTIGSSVFVAMGSAMHKGGPASLLLAYVIYCGFAGIVCNCEAEMATFMPVSAAFIRHASKWVDEAWGFMVGWNYFIYIGLGIPFEMTAVSLVLSFWRDDIPVAAVICVCIVLYTVINVLAVNYYGESEFWLSVGKILLFAIVFCFTFITMVGGNPKHDAYGFSHWRNPGPFVPYVDTGNLGKFEGFLACFWQASYVVAGPDYISIVAGEAKNPRKTLKSSFKTMYLRFALIFIGSALCIGIVLPSNDPTLVAVLTGTKPGSGTGAASPYIIAMENLGISVLPHIVNAFIVTSIFSAGNGYAYSATRALYGLACDGHAPEVFKRCTKAGVPVYAFAATMLFSALAFLQLSKSSANVYQIIVDITTAGGLIDFIGITSTYIFFYRACEAQGIDRRTLPYRGWGQPYLAYIALVALVSIVFSFGYMCFRPWDISDFFSYYTLLLLAPFTFTFWKVVKRTKIVKPHEADLVWDRPEIDAYEATLTEDPLGFWAECGQLIGIKRKKHVHVA